MNKLTSFLNNFSSEAQNYIKLNHLDIRESKNKIKDVLHYRFAYSNADKSATKEKITSSISFKNSIIKRDLNINNHENIKINRTSMHKKEQNVPLNLYKHLYDHIRLFYKNQFNIDDSVIIVDGVYSNTNLNHDGKSELSMSLGLYHSNESIPYDIFLTEGNKKNNEVICLKTYIENNIDYFKGKTIICDRAYFSTRFFNFLDQNGINFIIRIRDECNLALNKETKKGVKNYDDFVKFKINDHMRIISNQTKISKKLTDNASESVQINLDNKVHIASNLNKIYTNQNILDMYSSRWDIEEFFKLLKRNFKFQYFDEHYKDSYKKNIYCTLIIVLLKQILIKYYDQTCGDKLKTKTVVNKNATREFKINLSINETSLISGIYSDLLDKIFNSTLTDNMMIDFLNCYKNTQTNEQNRSFERKSKRPFTKWYVKKYHELYKLKTKSVNVMMNTLVDKNDIEAIKLKKEFRQIKKELTKKYLKDVENINNCYGK
jgi:predicted transcriptional regulator